jgi:DNA polymerase elongation subunit (family B)
MELSANPREHLAVMSVGYVTESEGHRYDEPIIQMYCRNADGERRYIEVEGFYPYFYITEDEFAERQQDLLTDHRVRYIESRERVIHEDNIYNTTIHHVDHPPAETLHDEPLVRVVTIQPQDVKGLREAFEQTWEADVFFRERFLIDTGIKRGVSVPTDSSRVHIDDISATEDIDAVTPRMVTIDIEVYTAGSFPEPDEAKMPITSYTMHDTYTDRYKVAVLRPQDTIFKDGDTWTGEPDWELPDGVSWDQVSFDIYDDENQMLADGNAWIDEHDPDILTGWNSSRNEMGNGFDYPYWVNRCRNINEWTYEDMSPEGEVFTTRRGEAVIRGRQLVDMLQAYKKTQIHEKRSYALGAIAEEELGYGKEDIDSTDDAWLYTPVDFMKYNIRDVQAVVDIENAKGVLDLYDHIRSITGATYSEIADSNIGLIDMLFLRKAQDDNIALPTSTRPERGWYYGAKVFNPVPGLHTNVVYPDLASLYPYLMWSLNISPETVYDTIEDAQADGYTEDDLYRAYVDRRPDPDKKNSDPDPEEIYYTKPDVKEGFVRSVITMLTDMKYEYKGTGKQYEAVKRITNSIYGVFGDSASYGRGFRLFDWRLAESITLAGQDVVTYTSDEFEEWLHTNGHENARRIGGDTDSLITTFPDLDVTPEEIQEDYERIQDGHEPTLPFFRAAEHVNKMYDTFMADRYWIDDPSMHKMEVEIESFADSLFFLQDFKSNDPNKGVKKRYSQLITWSEGEIIDEPEPATKGFELVRSDASEITVEAQQKVLEYILTDENPRENVEEYLQNIWEPAVSGDISLEKIAIPSAIKKPLREYGGPNVNGKYTTPQPQIRGARYANAHVDGEKISSGDKPMFFYVSSVTFPYPPVYVYDDSWTGLDDITDHPTMKEVGKDVNSISLNNINNLPDKIHIDYEKMAEKTIRQPIEPIVETMGWDFDDLIDGKKQEDLAAFM